MALYRVVVEMIDSRQVDFIAPDDLPSRVVQALAKQKATEAVSYTHLTLPTSDLV